jgi:hypothetical protein
MADADLVLNETIALPRGDAYYRTQWSIRSIVIDCNTDYADFSIAAHQGNVGLIAELRCLSVPSSDLSRLQRKTGDGYIVMRLKRPQPGFYELAIAASSSAPVTCSIAAYVKSPLRLNLVKTKDVIALGQCIDLNLSVIEAESPVKKLSVSAEMLFPTTSVKHLARQWKKEMGEVSAITADSSGIEVAQAQTVRKYLQLKIGRDPFYYVSKPIHLVHPKIAGSSPESIVLRASTSQMIAGTYNLRFVVQGQTNSDCSFRRVGFCSFLVG